MEHTEDFAEKDERTGIANKVVLLTGASSGIGLATARLLARKGARLALAARSAEKLTTLVAELPDAIAIPTDMRDEAAVQRMVAQAQQHYGRIDILINNAGQGINAPIETVNLNAYRSVFELNVVSVIAAIQAIVPIMRAQGGGTIVNISSGTTKIPPERYRNGIIGPYASTKAALNSLTLIARAQLAADNISLGLVYPGVTATSFFSNLAEGRQTMPSGGTSVDRPEAVAEKILEAVETRAAEVYADNLRKAIAPDSGR